MKLNVINVISIVLNVIPQKITVQLVVMNQEQTPLFVNVLMDSMIKFQLVIA